MDEFVRKFHNLAGANDAEHKKNFNAYIGELRNNQVDIATLIAKIDPTNLQEAMFRLSLMLDFEQYPAAMETFLQSDKILNKVLVKEERFVRLFRDVPPDEFVDRICPCISYVTRNHLIYKLSFLLEDGDAYYAAVHRSYGLQAARPLLIACTEAVLMSAFEEFNVSFGDRQLIHLHKKLPSFLHVYLKRHGFHCYHVLGQYLAVNDVELFRELLQYGSPKIGKRAFRKYLKLYKDDIIADPERHRQLPLRPRPIYSLLSREEFAEFFRNSLPTTPNSYSLGNKITSLILMLPLKSRGDFLFRAFEELYGFQMYGDDDYLKTNILEVLAAEDRVKFNLDDEHIEFFDVAKSVPTIKAKINLTSSINGRTELMAKLVRTCKLNRNEDELLEVLKYFCNRHKNDNHAVRLNFVQSVSNNFHLEKLSVAHWTYLKDLLLLFEVNGESWYGKTAAWRSFIVHRILNNLEYDDLLEYYVKSASIHDVPFLQAHPEHERRVILLMPKLLEAHFGEKDRGFARRMYLNWIAEFNERNPRLNIPMFQFSRLIREQLEESKENTYRYDENACVRYLFTVKPSNAEEEALVGEALETFLNCRAFYYNGSRLGWLLKRKPERLEEHARMFFESEWCHVHYFAISKMQYTALSRKVRNCALAILNDPNSEPAQVSSALTYLSYEKTADFERESKKYLPTGDLKIDVHDKSMEATLKIQQSILKCFKYVPAPRECIDSVLHFCRADYLQYALEPLYYVLYHTPEKSFAGPLNVLLDRAVSVRKHTIYLSSILGSTRFVYDVLSSMGEKEKNVSLRKFVFRRTFKRFVDEQSEEFWKLTARHLKLLDAKDEESVDLVLDVRKVPARFLSRYVQILWKHLKTTGRHFDLLRRLDDSVLDSLPDDLCDEIIRTALAKNNVDGFVAKYLSKANNRLKHRLETVWNCINELLSEGTKGGRLKSAPVIFRACDLVETLCIFLLNESGAGIVVEAMRAKLPELNLPCDKYELELALDATKFYVSSDKSISAIAAYIVRQQNAAIARHGTAVANFYGNFIARYVVNFFVYMSGDNFELYLQLVEALLEVDKSDEVRLLCLRLYPRDVPKNDRLVERQSAVLDRIADGCSAVVGMHLGHLLRNLAHQNKSISYL